MNIPQLIKGAVGKKCTYCSFVKDSNGETKLKVNVLSEEGVKKELRFNVHKEVNQLTEQDVKDLLHLVFKQIFTKSWNKEAEEVFRK